MALIFVIVGLLTVFVGLVPYAIPVVREAEKRLPDHDGVATDGDMK